MSEPRATANLGAAGPRLAEVVAPPSPGQRAGRTGRQFWRSSPVGIVSLLLLLGAMVIALLADRIAPYDPLAADFIAISQPPTAEHLLGTDQLGRDVLSRIMYGTRLTLLIAVAAVAIGDGIGFVWGLVAGYAGGRVDNALMRAADVVYGFPALLFFLIMQVSLRDTRVGSLLNGLVLLFITLSIVSWTGVARLVRGTTLVLKQREFVEAVRMSGARPNRVILRHVLPNALGPIVVAAAFTVPGAIVAEIVLSYLGIGVQPDVRLDAPFPTSWGYMILDGYKAWQAQPWMLVAPCLAVALITLAFTFVGDGLRDALDPRLGGVTSERRT